MATRISKLVRGPVALAVILVVGCGTEMQPKESERPTINYNEPEQVIKLFVTGEEAEPDFLLPDGTLGHGWAAYQSLVGAYVAAHHDRSFSVAFANSPLVPETSPLAPDSPYASQSNPIYVKIPYTSFGVRVDYEGNKWVGACVNRFGPTINLMLNRQTVNPPIVDLHIIGYRNGNNRPCLGLYNSGSFANFCTNICGPSSGDIQRAIYTVIVTAGVSSAVAYAVAAASTPVIMGLGVLAL